MTRKPAQSGKVHPTALEALRRLAVASWVAGLPREIKGDALWRALGYASRRTFVRAVETDSVMVKLRRDPKTGELTARATDVADWAWRVFVSTREAYDSAAVGRQSRRGGSS